MASTTANRIRTSSRQTNAHMSAANRAFIPQHLRPMGFVPRVRNMTLDEAFIDRDFDRYEEEIIQEYRKRSDEN